MMPHEQAPAPTSAAPTSPVTRHHGTSRGWIWTSIVLGVATTAAIVSSVALWQRLNNIQHQLALQSADSHGQAVEARTLARQAEDSARDTASRISVLEARVGEVALQRGQLEALMQSLSRSRDDNLVGDMESTIRFALQQSQLIGSPDPLVSSLKAAQQRIATAAQPRLAPLERAIAHDLDRIASSKSLDTAGLLARMDDLLRQVDELPLQNEVARTPTRANGANGANGDGAAPNRTTSSAEPASTGMHHDPMAARWWSEALTTVWNAIHDEARGLVRVRRIDYPDAVLLSPGETFFLRENLKLRIMNARLALLARQMTASRNDLATASEALHKYFDLNARRTQAASLQLMQLQQAMRDVDIPRANDTLAALATAAAGR